MIKTLRTAPFTIDAQAIAQGLLELFSEQDRTVLRFGMLPAEHMRRVETALCEKFLENAISKDGDQFIAICNIPGKRFNEFSMSKLISEAMREITLALYDIGDLVV